MKQITYVQAVNEALAEELERDEKVFILGESIQQGAFGTTAGLVQRFGADRIMDTPISETAIAGAAVGSAMTGYRPVADFMFADFMYIAFDEILCKAAKWRFMHEGTQKIPVVFMAAMGGYLGLGAEHSQAPVSYYMHTPGIKIAVPSTPYDAKGLMKSAIRDNNAVVYLYHKALLGTSGEIPEEEYVVPLGKADIKREGTDVTMVATGMQVHFALSVAEKMKDDVSIEVIDPRSLEPLDIDTIIASVIKTGRAIVVDEDTSRCGAAGEIAMQIVEKAFDYLDAPVQRVAAKNYPIPPGAMEQFVLPQQDQIAAAVKAVTG
ncbi:MAG: alpha-ketoacid dehydrogenase subunit beta [Desulfobacterales bacterium]